MAKLNLKESQINTVLNKLVPSWAGCIREDDLEKAQIPKSSTRKWLFGTIINQKFIKLNRAVNGFKKGTIVSIADIYNDESAQSLAGLIIYRLGHSGLTKSPAIAEV